MRKKRKPKVKFKRFVHLNEKKTTYEFSSTQVQLPSHLSEMVINYGNSIPDSLIYDKENYGKEKDIHVTLLYGIVDEFPEEVESFVSEFKPFKVKLGKVSAFTDGNDYDVLKIEAKSFVMNTIHYYLESSVENKNSFPLYKPHITIAYMKKGNVHNWVGDKKFQGMEFTVDSIVFSSLNGEKYTIELRG